MFEHSFTAEGKTKRDRAIACAIVLQTIAVTGLVLLPLARIPEIEAGKRLEILPPPPRASQPVKPLATQPASPSISHPRFTELRILPLVPRPSSHIAVTALPADALFVPGNMAASGSPDGVLAHLGNALNTAVPPSAPGKPKSPVAPVQISSTISQSQLVYGPKPVYPKLALTARIEGTVHLQATISTDGRIENLRVLNGHPLLNQAALDAVRDWRYRPLFLNGAPVEVLTEIIVTFTLHQ